MFRFKYRRLTFAYLNCAAARVGLLAFICLVAGGWQAAAAQTAPTVSTPQPTTAPQTAPSPQATPSPQPIADRHESERSDTLTGGRIELADFAPNEPDIRLTLNVPSFRLTLWQNGKEVKSYYIGVGKKEHPLYIGDRKATEIIWNPAWIPPASNWVSEIKSVRPGEVIPASDPRNPLGKLKIPLGDSYLIHQAAKVTDPGNLVSHGCVRMLRPELYDLAEKIVAARSLPVSSKRIDAAKRSLRPLVVRLDTPVPVDINYDTLVVEEGVLHIYPDVYGRGTNRPARLRAKLQAASVDVSKVSEKSIRQILSKATRRSQFVVETRSIAEGRALEDGRVVPLIPKRQKAVSSKQ
jgi:lipoprotein-anchoring transpeptidase ErfK/SrfK